MHIEKYVQDFIYSYESRLAHGTSTAEAECLLILYYYKQTMID